MGSLWIDVKLGMRMLVKDPLLTCVAMVALAVGIPLAVAPTHIVNAAEAPPPLEQSDRIQVLRNSDLERAVVRSTALYDFSVWREELTSFQPLGAAIDGVYNVISENGLAAPVEGAEVTASVFDILRVAPLMGRTLVASDEVTGAPEVVVIGHDFWEARLASDPYVVGRTLRVGGVARVVVGVMPKEFYYPWEDHIWIPLRGRAFTDDHDEERRLRVIGRLKDGISPEQAQLELTALGQAMAADLPETHARLRPQVVPYTIGIRLLPKGGFRAIPEFYLIQLVTILTLLLPSINIGMLVLARTATRSRELAVRMALGASRRRVILQLFMESFVLAVVAAGLGLLIADRITSGSTDPNWIDLGVTPMTVLWTLGLAVLSAAVVGVIPAIKVTGRDIHGTIQQAASGRSAVRFGGASTALIVADVALAVVILSVSVGLRADDSRGGMGIDADEFLFAELRMSLAAPEADGAPMSVTEASRLREAQEALARRLAGEPGVGGLAMASVLPGMDHPNRWIEVDGDGPRQRVRIARVDVGYFEALEQPILSGRGFDRSDIGENRSTVIVNTNFVDKVLGGRNPIGRLVRRWTRENGAGPWYEIVGTVGHLGMFANDAGRDAGVYYPLALGEIYPVPFVIRVGDDPGSFVPRLRSLTAEVDPTAIIWAPQALSDVFNAMSFLSGKLQAYALLVMGIMLTIATLAIYALMSFTVSQRTRELGVRIALGAGWRGVVHAIAKRAFMQLGVGALVGMAIAASVLHTLKTQFGWSSMDSPVLVASLVALGAVIVIGTLACIAPTMRALRIAPTDALADGT